MVNIDINNFPILGTMLERFKEYEPDIKLYLRNLPIYNGEERTSAEKLVDFNTVLKLYRNALIKREYFCDPQLIEALLTERSAQSVTILIFKLSDHPFINWYNTQVLKNVQQQCATVLSTISNEYDFLFTGEKENELNLISSFQKYYNAFAIEAISVGANEAIPQAENSLTRNEISEAIKVEIQLAERVGVAIEVPKNSLLVLDYKPEGNLDPLTFINPSILSLFLSAEKKVLEPDGKFPNKIRCAAFCEMLYKRKYIIQSKQNQKQMRDFALVRYQLNISNALLSVKHEARDKHKNFTVDGMPPLKNFF